jgi:hypothetical protein
MAQATSNHTLSSLIRDPFVRAAFEAAERDGLAPVCTKNLKSDHSGDEVRPGWRLNE